jgi:hypothetical protein
MQCLYTAMEIIGYPNRSPTTSTNGYKRYPVNINNATSSITCERQCIRYGCIASIKAELINDVIGYDN